MKQNREGVLTSIGVSSLCRLYTKNDVLSTSFKIEPFFLGALLTNMYNHPFRLKTRITHPTSHLFTQSYSP
jgi:hypothetical protein